jgi:hypothetical protein
LPVVERLAPAEVNHDLHAVVAPPIGWHTDPPKRSSRHDHQVWISPSGRTAYGVIYIRLPLPVGYDLTLWGFLREMRRAQGEANLLQELWDPNLSALRFVAEGGLYRIRTNLFVNGFDAWAVYAGTLRDQPIDAIELDLAERAREYTGVGLSDAEHR